MGRARGDPLGDVEVMPRLKVGVRVEVFQAPLRQALNQASRLGIPGIQVNALGGLAPQNLSQSGRRDFLNLLRTLNLQLVALAFPTRRGYDTADELDRRVAQTEKVLKLSYDLRAPIVVNAIGRVPEAADDPARQLLTESLTRIGRSADRVGATFAVTTGAEPPATLRQFLDGLAVGGLGITYDPAALLMNNFDPIVGVRELAGRIVLTHARDARRPGLGGLAGREAPIGRGDLDWAEYLAALEEAAYHGWFIITGPAGPDPAADVQRAVDFLGSF